MVDHAKNNGRPDDIMISIVGIFHAAVAGNWSRRIGWLTGVFAAVLFSSITLSHQAMAGGPLMEGKTLVQGTDRVNGRSYGDPTAFFSSNSNAKTLRVYKGDQVTFYYRLNNWDPLPIAGEVNAKYYAGPEGRESVIGSETFDPGAWFMTGSGYRYKCTTNYGLPYLFNIPVTCWGQRPGGWNNLFSESNNPNYVLRHTVRLDGPEFSTPGKRYCAYVETNPTLYDMVNAALGSVVVGQHKFNSHDDSFDGEYQTFSVAFFWLMAALSAALGDQMSCAEIAYNYNLTPEISLDNPSGSTVGASPSVTQDAAIRASGNATYTQPTEWRISQFTLPSSPDPNTLSTLGVKESNTRGANLCTYFNNDTAYRNAGISNCTSAVAKSTGSDTIYNTDGSFRSGSSFPTTLPFPDPATIPAGRVVCYVLSINTYKPYLSNPSWRHSKTACTDGSPKKPKVSRSMVMTYV